MTRGILFILLTLLMPLAGTVVAGAAKPGAPKPGAGAPKSGAGAAKSGAGAAKSGATASPVQPARVGRSSGGVRVYRSRYYGGRRYSRPPAARLPQVSTGEVEAANQRLLAARGELARTQRALDQLVVARSKSPEMAAALDALQEARAAHDRADAAVALALRQNSEYVAALARKEDVQRRLDRLRDSGAGNAGQIAALAAEAMNWGSTATRIQAEAERADPDVSNTKAKLLAADERVRGAEASQSPRNDPAWMPAKNARDQAKANVAAAEAAWRAAEQRLAAGQYAYDQASLYNQRLGYSNNRGTRVQRY